MDHWEFVAERKIQEALEAGEFDNLPLHGKPIPLDRDPLEDPSLWMAHHLLRVNGFAPAWIEESNDIEREIEHLRRDVVPALNRKTHYLDEFRDRLTELNRRILQYNLKSPSMRFHKPLLDLDAELLALQDARAGMP